MSRQKFKNQVNQPEIIKLRDIKNRRKRITLNNSPFSQNIDFNSFYLEEEQSAQNAKQNLIVQSLIEASIDQQQDIYHRETEKRLTLRQSKSKGQEVEAKIKKQKLSQREGHFLTESINVDSKKQVSYLLDSIIKIKKPKKKQLECRRQHFSTQISVNFKNKSLKIPVKSSMIILRDLSKQFKSGAIGQKMWQLPKEQQKCFDSNNNKIKQLKKIEKNSTSLDVSRRTSINTQVISQEQRLNSDKIQIYQKIISKLCSKPCGDNFSQSNSKSPRIAYKTIDQNRTKIQKRFELSQSFSPLVNNTFNVTKLQQFVQKSSNLSPTISDRHKKYFIFNGEGKKKASYYLPKANQTPKY